MSIESRTCILLPALNEERTLGGVIDGFRAEGFDNIVVVDGGSTDETQAIARERGVRLLIQSGSGKGQAIREARECIDAEYILMADADQTYRPTDAQRMLQPLADGDADCVIGNRFANLHPGSMTRLNQLGNRLINWTFVTAHQQSYKDILSGYRAFTKTAFRRLYLTVDGFGVETEMAVESARTDLRTVVVPIHYDPRPDGSETNLAPLSHGFHIMKTVYGLAKTSNPLFYFGVLGLVAMTLGAFCAGYVGLEWVLFRHPHHVIALVSAFFLLVGVQLTLFGILADMILSFHKRQMRTLNQVEEQPRDTPNLPSFRR
jgi:dolichol-phosphate mannosyltransferase